MTIKELIDEWLGCERPTPITYNANNEPNVNAHLKQEPKAWCYDWGRLFMLYAYKRKPLFVVLARQQSGSGLDYAKVSTAWKHKFALTDATPFFQHRLATSRGLVRGHMPLMDELSEWHASFAKEAKAPSEPDALFCASLQTSSPSRARYKLYALRPLADGKGWSPQCSYSWDSAPMNDTRSTDPRDMRPCAPEMLSMLCSMREGDTAQVEDTLPEPVAYGFVAARNKRRASWGHKPGKITVGLTKIFKQSDAAREWINQRVVLRGLSKET